MATTATARAEPLIGTVVGVSDGDTITILDKYKQQHKIRVAGIDAPEHAQPFGQRAKENLSRLVFRQEVEIVGDGTDRYNRIVGKVMVASPDCREIWCPRIEDAGRRQIEAGLAWWYRRYSREQSSADRVAYEAAEQQARTGRAGLWSDRDPTPPWEWRRAGKR